MGTVGLNTAGASMGGASPTLAGGSPHQLQNDLDRKYYVDDDGYVQFPDGSRYKGPLKNGNPDGMGIIIYADGSRYEGDWKAGNSHGFGNL